MKKGFLTLYYSKKNIFDNHIKKIKGYLLYGFKNVRIGKGVVISNVELMDGVTINDYCRIIGQPKITIGKDVYINCFSMMQGEIEIGDNALISQFVNIWGRSHCYSDKNELIWDQHGNEGQGYKIMEIIIKKGAWIGPHVTILRGVTIGEGAVVGAGAVVTHSIPDFAIAFGIPAKIVGFRGSENEKCG